MEERIYLLFLELIMNKANYDGGILLTGVKKQLIDEQYQFVEWVKTLKNMPESDWLKPYAEGKWSPAEILSHLVNWDRFMISLNIHTAHEGDQLPAFPDVQEENDKAATYAREKVTKEELIDEFVLTRQQFIDQIEEIEDGQLNANISVGTFQLTIKALIEDFKSHDLHHAEQIKSIFVNH